MVRVGNYCLCVQSEETHVTSIPGVMSRMYSSLLSAEKGCFWNADLKSCLVAELWLCYVFLFSHKLVVIIAIKSVMELPHNKSVTKMNAVIEQRKNFKKPLPAKEL